MIEQNIPFKQGLLLHIFIKSRSALKIPTCIRDISLTIVWAIVTDIIKFIQARKGEREKGRKEGHCGYIPLHRHLR